MYFCHMQRRVSFATGVVLAIMLVRVSPVSADDFPEFNRDPAQARIVDHDLARFWKAWDLAERDPDRRREIFQREYLDAGTPGLEAFVEMRIGSVDRLLAAIDRSPRYYASLRELTPRMAAAAEPVRAAMRELHALLPEAVFPDTYLMVGRMSTGGTIHWSGLLVGAEMYGLTPDSPTGELSQWHRSVVKPMSDLPVIVVHELIHMQQANLTRAGPPSSLLGVSIHEGAADFLTELVLDRHINTNVHAWASPREAELWREFRTVMHDEDYSGWLYDGINAPADRPADLGYFIGYRITQAYYNQARDKHAAIREIVAMTDPVTFLKASGYEHHLLAGTTGSHSPESSGCPTKTEQITPNHPRQEATCLSPALHSQ